MHNICDHEGLGYVEFSVPGLFSTNWFASLNMKTEQGVMGVYFPTGILLQTVRHTRRDLYLVKLLLKLSESETDIYLSAPTSHRM